MSRGDEFEAGQPPPQRSDDEIGAGLPPARSRMSEVGDDDRDADEQDIRRTIDRPRRSGAVTAVGILAICLGAFVLLGSICTAFTPTFTKSMVDLAEKVNPNDPNLPKLKQSLEDLPIWYFIVMAVVEFFRAIGLIAGGVGVLRRSNIGRLLVLGLATLGIILVFIGVAAGFAMNTIKLDDPGSLAGGICGFAFSVILNVGFAILAFLVLLNKKNVAEFRA